jgi:hypothetical protein
MDGADKYREFLGRSHLCFAELRWEAIAHWARDWIEGVEND